MCDNKGAIEISRNGVRSRRVRHIDLANMYVQTAEQEGWIQCLYIDTKSNPVDCMTKPFGPQKFKDVPDLLQIRND
jgi:hypothetical protein